MTPSGTLLIVGMDGQVSGGYPRIFQLSDDALSILVQKKAGDKISFKLLDKPLQRAL
jgi:allophanate hydrolase subunit 2